MAATSTTWDDVPRSMEPPFGASVVVFRRAAMGVEFLVLHRAHNGADNSGEGAWTPPAGARQPDESVLDCARRELSEETGLLLEPVLSSHGSSEWVVYSAEADLRAVVHLDEEHD